MLGVSTGVDSQRQLCCIAVKMQRVGSSAHRGTHPTGNIPQVTCDVVVDLFGVYISLLVLNVGNEGMIHNNYSPSPNHSLRLAPVS